MRSIITRSTKSVQECLEVTGKKPVAIWWVDTYKGDEENPEYRSRIVAKDLKTRRDPSMPAIDTIAPMPALEMIKLLLSLAATWRKSRRGRVLCIMVVDEACPLECGRPYYLPEEDWEEGMCGLALKSLYGFLDAASCWSDEVRNMLRETSFQVGASNPALFRHDTEDVLGLVHGGDDEGQGYFEACLKKRYQYKCEGDWVQGLKTTGLWARSQSTIQAQDTPTSSRKIWVS